MSFEFIFPDVGEGVHEGTIVKWLVNVGDIVKEDQPLGEVETDKAIVEMPSPRAGKILSLNYKPGEVVKVGASLLSIDDGSGTTAKKAAPKQAEAEPVEEKREYQGIVGDLSGAQTVITQSRAGTSAKGTSDKAKVSPSARRLAKDLGVDLGSVKGTGTGGEITIEDIKKAASVAPLQTKDNRLQTSESTAPTEKPGVTIKKKYDMYGYIDRIPYKGMRKAIGDHMVLSTSKIPRVSHMDEADVTDLMKLREKEKKNAEKEGVKLTLLPFIVKAVWAATEKHPTLNAFFDETAGEIIVKKYLNCGIAVDTGDGLVVPVLIRAETQSIMQIAKNIQDLAEKARNNKLGLMDMKGGSFTITNVGSIGGIHATAIVNYPECAILLLGRTRELPRYVNGKLEPRQIMPLTLTFDHRIADGAEAARWMNTFKEHLEDPDLFIIE